MKNGEILHSNPTEMLSKEKDSAYKAEKMRRMLALGMLVLPAAGLVAGLHGMGSSAEQARDTLDELIKDVNAQSQTYEGISEYGEPLQDTVVVNQDGAIELNGNSYNDDQAELIETEIGQASGEELAQDIHAVEEYVTDTYGEGNVPTEFTELFEQAEQEIAYNRNSSNLAAGSAVAGIIGLAGSIGILHTKRKDPTNPANAEF
jgi:hypothetical protein